MSTLHHQKLDPEKLSAAYGISLQSLYPWPGVVDPPFGAAWAVVKPGEETKHHAHQEAETFFFAKGRGVMRVGDVTREVQAGDVVFQPPLMTHTLVNTSESEDILFLTIYWEDLRLWTGGRTEPTAAARPARVMVTAAPPTPNGDLHVGHLSGPYLAGDIYSRYLRQRGIDARYVSGSDDNQSYVKTNGVRLRLGPQAAADTLSADIVATLQAANIRLEEFVRPNASPHHASMTQAVFRALHQSGHLVERETLSPWCETCERYLYEAYIRGRCPHCNAASGGNLCEDCGRTNDCIDLVDAVCTTCSSSPVKRTFKRLFFPLSRWEKQLREFHHVTAMNPSLRALCEQTTAAGLPDLAVTHISDWGIAVPVEQYEHQRIFVWFEMAARYLAYARHLESVEAYWKSEDAAIVQCFGFDNGFYYAVFLPAIYMAFDSQLRLPTAFLMNEFYRLNGRKFSTSRRHAIWGRDLLAKVPSDIVRFYLSYTRPEVEGTNFTLEEFGATCDRELVGNWQAWLNELATLMATDFGNRVPATGDWTPEHRAFHDRIVSLCATVASSYEASTFSPCRAAHALCELVREARQFGGSEDKWRRSPSRGEERRTAAALQLLAAKMLAIASAPIMPEFAARLWQALGYEVPFSQQRWETQPSWVPAGQRIDRLEGPHFSNTSQALRLQSATDQ